MNSLNELLEWDVFQNVGSWLSCFDTDIKPAVGIGMSGETMWVKNFPLPDKYEPDRIDIALILNQYPIDPPKGIYLLSEATNRSLIQTLRQRFNVFQNTGFHGAPNIDGYEWICVGYLHGWKYNVNAPRKGDNIGKMLQHFWRILEE